MAPLSHSGSEQPCKCGLPVGCIKGRARRRIIAVLLGTLTAYATIGTADALYENAEADSVPGDATEVLVCRPGEIWLQPIEVPGAIEMIAAQRRRATR